MVDWIKSSDSRRWIAGDSVERVSDLACCVCCAVVPSGRGERAVVLRLQVRVRCAAAALAVLRVDRPRVRSLHTVAYLSYLLVSTDSLPGSGEASLQAGRQGRSAG
jgi:hypothetical protein